MLAISKKWRRERWVIEELQEEGICTIPRSVWAYGVCRLVGHRVPPQTAAIEWPACRRCGLEDDRNVQYGWLEWRWRAGEKGWRKLHWCGLCREEFCVRCLRVAGRKGKEKKVPIFEIKLQVESREKPWTQEMVRVLEKGLQLKVVSQSETIRCGVCGEPAEVIMEFKPERKRWWEFWKDRYRFPGYSLRSTHPCYREYAEKYAEPESPWYQACSSARK